MIFVMNTVCDHYVKQTDTVERRKITLEVFVKNMLLTNGKFSNTRLYPHVEMWKLGSGTW